MSQVKEFYSFCGGLPAPECINNPLRYKFSWSPRGNLLVHLNSATYLADGQEVHIPGKDLMNAAKPYPIIPSLSLVAFPNRSSLPFRDIYNIPEAETVGFNIRPGIRIQTRNSEFTGMLGSYQHRRE